MLYNKNIMSVYSGFTTRSLESSYNRCLYGLIFLLQMRVHRSINNSIYIIKLVTLDEPQFSSYFAKLYSKIVSYENQKYIPPKFSYAIKDLAEDYGLIEKACFSSTLKTESVSYDAVKKCIDSEVIITINT